MDLTEVATVAGSVLLTWFGRPHVEKFRHRNGNDRRSASPPPCALSGGNLPVSIQTLVTRMSEFMDDLSDHMKSEAAAQKIHLRATERVLHVARATAKKVGVEGWTLVDDNDGGTP